MKESKAKATPKGTKPKVKRPKGIDHEANARMLAWHLVDTKELLASLAHDIRDTHHQVAQVLAGYAVPPCAKEYLHKGRQEASAVQTFLDEVRTLKARWDAPTGQAPPPDTLAKALRRIQHLEECIRIIKQPDFPERPTVVASGGGYRLAVADATTGVGKPRPWYVGYSPRNNSHCAEGYWEDWVALAEDILTENARRGAVLAGREATPTKSRAEEAAEALYAQFLAKGQMAHQEHHKHPGYGPTFLAPPDQGEPSYGYYMGGDPRWFAPDPDVCTDKELARWKEDCALMSQGKLDLTDPARDKQTLYGQGSYWVRTHKTKR